MVNNAHFLVYQAYGLEDVLNEALVSVGSLFQVTEIGTRPTVVIYTDSKEYLASYLPESIVYKEVPKTIWETWKGEKSFVHRAKIQMLRDFCQHHEGSVLYCDTDTYFLTHPSTLFNKLDNGCFLMHTDEGMLDGSVNKVFQKLERFLKSYSYQGQVIASTTHMWNAGVLGFHTKEKEVLDEVLGLSDDLFASYPKHVMEQLAFSYYFGKRKRQKCEDEIFHYWDFKEYRGLLHNFFKQNRGVPFEDWQSQLDAIHPREMIKAKHAFLKKPYLLRKALKWIGKDYRLS